jgi:hypothetical protein
MPKLPFEANKLKYLNSRGKGAFLFQLVSIIGFGVVTFNHVKVYAKEQREKKIAEVLKEIDLIATDPQTRRELLRVYGLEDRA